MQYWPYSSTAMRAPEISAASALSFLLTPQYEFRFGFGRTSSN
jgi:hypothetical protein